MSARQRPVPSALPPRPVVIANRHPRLKLDRRAVTHAIHALDANHEAIGIASAALPRGELSIVFLTDSALAELHAQFLDDPTTTDVITFEGDPAPGLPEAAATAGEICVSADTAARYARTHGRDFSTELTLYVVHGWLHLAGHDDLVPAKKRAMRRAEQRAMRVLEQAGALPTFRLNTSPSRPS